MACKGQPGPPAHTNNPKQMDDPHTSTPGPDPSKEQHEKCLNAPQRGQGHLSTQERLAEGRGCPRGAQPAPLSPPSTPLASVFFPSSLQFIFLTCSMMLPQTANNRDRVSAKAISELIQSSNHLGTEQPRADSSVRGGAVRCPIPPAQRGDQSLQPSPACHMMFSRPCWHCFPPVQPPVPLGAAVQRSLISAALSHCPPALCSAYQAPAFASPTFQP